MKVVQPEEIKNLMENLALQSDLQRTILLLDLQDYLENENPILYFLLEDLQKNFQKPGKEYESISVNCLLWVINLLKPLPKVTALAVQRLEEERKQYRDEAEALQKEVQLFRKQNPYLYDFIRDQVDILFKDQKSKGKVLRLLIEWIRLIRLQEEVEEELSQKNKSILV